MAFFKKFLNRFRPPKLSSEYIPPRNPNVISHEADCVIFIHGFGTDRVSTWRSALDLLEKDIELDRFAFYSYAYPTSLLDLFGVNALPPIQTLARGLETELNLHHSHRKKIIFVCHSLGGLVARQFLVNRVKASKEAICSRALLLSTPNSGANIADIAATIGLANRQSSQLRPLSDAIESLNDDWVHLNLDDALPITYVAAGRDRIVSVGSSRGISARSADETLVDYSHNNIIQCKSYEDLNYSLIKKFIINEGNGIVSERQAVSRPGDPLFEIYRKEDEPFYVDRDLDLTLRSAYKHRHIWIIGRSGVGKTAALKRNFLYNADRQFHVMLSSHDDPSPFRLLMGICVELEDRLGISTGLKDSSSQADLIASFRKSLREFDNLGEVCILIEEIPLNSTASYETFLGYVELLLLALEQENAHNVRLLFSTIYNPSSGVLDASKKLMARLQFVEADIWSEAELEKLVNVIDGALLLRMDEAKFSAIAKAAEGSPRFVKTALKTWISAGRKEEALLHALAQTRQEQIS